MNKEEMICPICGSIMRRKLVTQKFKINGRSLELSGIEAFACEECEENCFSSKDAKMIEKLLNAFDGGEQREVDVLNLEETAQALRVSNQTIYNMIRDGRIKARKVGREWRFLRSEVMSLMEEDNTFSIAAKGGSISSHDSLIIEQEIEKRTDGK